MNIYIYNIQKESVQLVDEIAKSRNMSRNAFLKLMIENIGTADGIKSERERLALALNKVNDALKVHNDRVVQLEKRNEKLYTLVTLATGIRPDEVDQVLWEIKTEDGFDMTVFD